MRFQKFKCLECGEQTTVTDYRGKPFRYLSGVKVIEIQLKDENDVVFSSISGITFCKKCDISKLDAEEVKEAVVSGDSGIDRNIREFGLAHKIGISLVKEF